MRIRAFRSLRPRFLGGLLLSLLLLTFPVAVRATGIEATVPDCAQTGLNPQPVGVQLTRTGDLVQATLHSPPSDLPATDCLVPLRFQIPEDTRPPQAVWRDVEARAVHMDGTPDPAYPDPLPLRLWIRPDGTLEYEVREVGVPATHAALNLAVAWGTTAAANDLAVLDILYAALGLELDFLNPAEVLRLELGEFGVWWDDRGRVSYLDWQWRNRGSIMHLPDIRVGWKLPSELGQLTALSWLALGGPLLTGTIPPELGQLANLERLTLAGSRLTGAVPPELGQLVQLTSLELHGNRLTALPPELGQLPRLRHLILHGNRLTSLPPQLGQLAQLQYLGLAGNRLTSLPPELKQLARLRGLGLAGNRLTSLPPELGQLPTLEFLDVQDNQLTSLPSLAGLQHLGYLDLSGNRLTQLPPGLELLPFLSRLDLSDNQLTALSSAWLQPRWGPLLQVEITSDTFERLLHRILHGTTRLRSPGSPLTMLDLSGNRLTALPPEIGRLRPDHLDLSDNRLTSLPPEIGRLRLGLLDLSGNQLTALPPEIGRLRLQHLDLSNNNLTSLPPELGRLQAVYRPPGFEPGQWFLTVDLSGNRLTDVPDALLQVDQLQRLNLSGNQLETLPPEIRELSTLDHLDLSGNQLTTLPAELGALSELFSLDLSDNQLATLPPELGQLSGLLSLDLSGNQLATLPPELGQLSSLLSLDLSGNQLTVLPPAVAKGILDALIGNNNYNEKFLTVSTPPYLFRVDHLDLSNNPLIALPPHPKTAPPYPEPFLGLKLRQIHLSDLHADLERAARWPNRVTHLDLSDNQLTEVPPSLTLLRNLQDLNLSHNKITDFFLPLGQLETLYHLNLSHNQLTDLPLDLDQVQLLFHLDLSHNQLTDLPVAFDQLVRLEHLNLSHNQFTEIPAGLSQLPPLRFLDLSGNPLATCALPLHWQINRYVHPPSYPNNPPKFNQWLLSPPPSTEHPDLPFLDLCPE